MSWSLICCSFPLKKRRKSLFSKEKRCSIGHHLRRLSRLRDVEVRAVGISMDYEDGHVNSCGQMSVAIGDAEHGTILETNKRVFFRGACGRIENIINY